MTSVTVGNVTIKQENDYGPDGRREIMWTIGINDADEAGHVLESLHEHELLQLHVALKAWRKANGR